MSKKIITTLSNGYLEKLSGLNKNQKSKITTVIADKLNPSLPLAEAEKAFLNNPPSPVAVKFSDLSGYIKKK